MDNVSHEQRTENNGLALLLVRWKGEEWNECPLIIRMENHRNSNYKIILVEYFLNV